MGIPNNSKDWVVNCALPPNCNTDICSDFSTTPFALRAVDTHGGLDDRRLGGFFSEEFYIRPLPSPSSTSISASSTKISSSTSSSTAATSLDEASTETSTIPTASPTAAAVASDTSSNSTAIGVGVGVGTAVALLLSAAAVCLWRHNRRRREKKTAWHPPEYPECNTAYQQKPERYQVAAAPVEVPTREPQELPTRQLY